MSKKGGFLDCDGCDDPPFEMCEMGRKETIQDYGWVEVTRVLPYEYSDHSRAAKTHHYCPDCVEAGKADLSGIEQAILMHMEAGKVKA